MMEIYLCIGIICFLIILLIWAIKSSMEQSKKDWNTLDYLKNKANLLKTKEEIEEFHKEFVEKASKIHNQFINPELSKIDGYLRGLYKQYQ